MRGLDPENALVLVGCPSCKVGIKRSSLQMLRHNPVVPALVSGCAKWKKDFTRRLDAATARKGDAVAAE